LFHVVRVVRMNWISMFEGNILLLLLSVGQCLV
jgi:hypothetical protein